MKNCCGQKHKQRGEDEYRSLINRLSRIEGQVRGVKAMVAEDAYCPDILTQVSAVRAALAAFEIELLSSHIRTCVTDGLRMGDDSVTDELVNTVQRMLR